MIVQWASPETLWCLVMVVAMVTEVLALSGPNVCMVQQKYNITKRVKYRAPMSVRTYEWCFAMPPRCSKWSTEMRDLTRLETEERTAEVAVCCPGYKMKEVSCVPICPSGKMGHGCTEDCPPDKWGPNCVNECPECLNGFCVPSTGECDCEEGWQGESCQISMSTVQAAPALMEELLTTTKSTIKTPATTKSTIPTTRFTEIVTPTPNPRATLTDSTKITTTSTPLTTTLKVTSTKKTFTSTDKTEIIIKSTKPTKSTSFYIYDNITTTPFTIKFIETETTETVPKVTITNFIYNRTETPEEEPEHITAVMNDKERDHTSVDLISVISIAGGVMMAVITVAVVIVMIERCKRPRYDDVRKVNDIRMQVMIDNKDPPPYVRSIFHTPLPDPPTSTNCHYQPISTLDRNLKQFMRPVVVQAISPIMLENFRGILECHYDHLPTNRNHRINDFGTLPTRCSVSPSMKTDDELLRQRPLSVAEYTIEALKREAKMDIIDDTTSEPLYAEIPCWRPPSEHAIEVINGEAVTEL
ncbi:uncharacterized protein LOC112052641 isoform X3 [Bicyclus anynana]|uniref:Uncharacterized protein LOC112052641 isoform X3 n=1 Tax=Bicyclus anynana TaxID=110368 RepID=A0A6J1NRU5_BICAN|nr:uncharacterized protein LOC112052641 isoform X3 [Bicyclus anynana]